MPRYDAALDQAGSRWDKLILTLTWLICQTQNCLFRSRTDAFEIEGGYGGPSLDTPSLVSGFNRSRDVVIRLSSCQVERFQGAKREKGGFQGTAVRLDNLRGREPVAVFGDLRRTA